MGIRQHLQSAWSDRRVRIGACGAMTVIGLLVGGGLIAAYIASIPPDPATDDPEAVVDYFLSNHFDRLSEAQRREYAQTMLQRYASMDSQQRERVDAKVRQRRRSDRDQLRERMITMWKDFAVNEARQYVALHPDEREAWLDQRIAMWQMLGGNPDGNRTFGGRRRGGRDDGDQRLTPDRQERIVGFFQNEVMPRSSARDRALVTVLMRDLQRRGERR